MARIFEYTDYRKFLHDWCEEQRERSKVFSYRNFARKGGISSSGFLKSVMDGSRNLTKEAIGKFVKAMDLDGEEATFFEDLVLFNQAETHAEKNHHYKRMMSCRRFLDAHKLEHDSFDYFSKWYYTAIREMIVLPDFVEDHEWIASRLNPSVSEKEVAHAIETLISLGLAERDESGKLRMSQQKLVTDDEISSVNITNFHRSMIRQAEESLSTFKAADRHVGSITVAMKREKFDEVKKRLNEFRKELWALLEDTEGAEEVYQINFQLFGLTKGERDEA